VNGGLFSGSAEVPRFSKMARSYLLHIGNLDWKKINPDIFGSMIQAVAEDEERGALGMHYTSVPNILKVLNPLFLDDLREKLAEAGDNPRKLLNMRNRMARIRVFDPACGSGNFLVIAYKEMRAIEAEINQRRNEPHRRTDIPLTNFRGIELRDFPAEIARLALIIAEYQSDELYRGQREALQDFLPLRKENWITCGNALRLVLVGPPELEKRLTHEAFGALNDRIAHDLRLNRLSRDEVHEYLHGRLRNAGYDGPRIFSVGAVRAVAVLSRGLPERINLLADKALMAASLAHAFEVHTRDVQVAARELRLSHPVPRRRLRLFSLPLGAGFAAGVTSALAAVALALHFGWMGASKYEPRSSLGGSPYSQALR
jgi:hypothetical protein